MDWPALGERLWGHGEDLDALQMALRALGMFFLVLLEIRVAGSRSFGRRSSFDNVVVMMLGAIAARGVVGASPFGSTVAATAVIVALHRVLGRVCITQPWLARLIEGERVLLYVRGQLLRDKLLLTSISEEDVLQSHRLERQMAALSPRVDAYLERNGRISFVKNDEING